jgi:hypothetical protein
MAAGRFCQNRVFVEIYFAFQGVSYRRHGLNLSAQSINPSGGRRLFGSDFPDTKSSADGGQKPVIFVPGGSGTENSIEQSARPRT